MVSGCDGGYSVLNEAKWPNTMPEVVCVIAKIKISSERQLMGEVHSQVDQLFPNMEAETHNVLSSCSLW